MNANAKRWCEALESGRFAQIKGRLRRPIPGKEFPGFCALGVACDLFAAEARVDWRGSSFLGEGEFLPEAVRDWLGLQNVSGTFVLGGKLVSIVDLGDHESISFHEIAALIRSEPPGLFEDSGE